MHQQRFDLRIRLSHIQECYLVNFRTNGSVPLVASLPSLDDGEIDATIGETLEIAQAQTFTALKLILTRNSTKRKGRLLGH